ncbi:MAG: response regulator transcription factor [Pleurocapsa minor GSE-CHR-MK-17-07R]|jgi:DNA-binding NarL/FixJ family response regulator|nr:response regulator transcription factor [Pleurocapsa minor GSE-CHR-MK 17-07R]
MALLKLMLVDDHEVVRMGLRMLLEQLPEVSVVAEAGTADDAVRLCGMYQPDVVIMDIRMPPGSSGIEACRTIMSRWPLTQVIMLTSFASDDLIVDAIKAGAVGYVLKQGGTGELVRALDAVRHGASLLDPGVTRRVLAMLREHGEGGPDPFREMTERELDVLRLVAEGRSNAEIGDALSLSDKTVRNHISVILSKLHVSNRVEAATYAVGHDIRNYRAP